MREQNKLHCRYPFNLSDLHTKPITVQKGERLFCSKIVKLLSKKGATMFITLAVLICLALLAFAGGDWYFSQFNPDDLSAMGVEKR